MNCLSPFVITFIVISSSLVLLDVLLLFNFVQATIPQCGNSRLVTFIRRRSEHSQQYLVCQLYLYAVVECRRNHRKAPRMRLDAAVPLMTHNITWLSPFHSAIYQIVAVYIIDEYYYIDGVIVGRTQRGDNYKSRKTNKS